MPNRLPPIETLTEPDKVVWRPISTGLSQEWQEYECFLPRGGRYDFAPEIVIDGKPEGGISFGGIEGGTRCTLRVRFGTDDDRRTKQILKAQNIPFDEKLVTLTLEYHLNNGKGTSSNHVVKSLRVANPGAGGMLRTAPAVRKLGEPIHLREWIFVGKDEKQPSMLAFFGEPGQEESDAQYTQDIVKAGGHRVIFRWRVERSRYPAPR
jgi:hypothetical protein